MSNQNKQNSINEFFHTLNQQNFGLEIQKQQNIQQKTITPSLSLTKKRPFQESFITANQYEESKFTYLPIPPIIKNFKNNSSKIGIETITSSSSIIDNNSENKNLNNGSEIIKQKDVIITNNKRGTILITGEIHYILKIYKNFQNLNIIYEIYG